MAIVKRFQVFVLLLVLNLAVYSFPSCRIIVEASRPTFVNRQAGFSKMAANLGVVCKCCDGENGECSNTWNASCSKPKCFPWKYVH